MADVAFQEGFFDIIRTGLLLSIRSPANLKPFLLTAAIWISSLANATANNMAPNLSESRPYATDLAQLPTHCPGNDVGAHHVAFPLHPCENPGVLMFSPLWSSRRKRLRRWRLKSWKLHDVSLRRGEAEDTFKVPLCFLRSDIKNLQFSSSTCCENARFAKAYGQIFLDEGLDVVTTFQLAEFLHVIETL